MNERIPEHPTPQQLAAFGRHALSDEETATLEEHVGMCDSCRLFLETLAEDPLQHLVRQATTSAFPGEPQLRLHAGYEILEEIGAGGMGVVFKARQAGLGRLVALKRIHAGGHPRPEVLSRFRREAEAVARLDHPNIVRIYEVGEQDGQPYLALEYVAGGTLGKRLAGNPLAPTAAAALVETLARAIDHAHRQGIVHRDLKPANILLSDAETPKITDFGLAKLLDQKAVQTQTGEIVGTPGYMAPEQATGSAHVLGPAADIYALGTILYEALTGRPPFQGATVLDTLELVRTQEPVPPSRLQPKLPRDLNTVCLKCLQKAPEQRYSNASALADDLRRFREGAPILARPVPLWERAWKGARRRPALAGLMALSGLAVVASIVGLWLHTTRLDEQVRRAEQERQRADTNYQQARQAINQMVARLNKFHAPGVPQVEALRRELRTDVLRFFEEIAKAEADPDPATRFDLARAYLQMAAPQLKPSTAEDYLHHARRLLEQLSADSPTNHEYQVELSKCFDRLGLATSAQGRLEDAIDLQKRGLAIYQELCRREPANAAAQRDLATIQINLGCRYYDAGRLVEAEPHWHEAMNLQEKLVQQHPEDAAHQYLLAVNYSNVALLYAHAGRFSEADALYRKSEPLLERLVRDHPEERDWGWALAQTLRCWGALLNDARRGEESRPLLTRAVQFMEERVREDPSNPTWQELLLGCLMARINNSTLLHRREEGERDWQRGLALSAQLKTWDEMCGGALWDARFGDHALAVTRTECLLRQPGLTSANRFELAKAYALAAAAARKDAQLPSVQQELKAEGYAAAGVVLLSSLSREGYFKDASSLVCLKTGEDLKPLRQRIDYQELLARVQDRAP
jgi:tetratricopeptide (TPR) repeat protein